jgi:hypothetical protein
VLAAPAVERNECLVSVRLAASMVRCAASGENYLEWPRRTLGAAAAVPYKQSLVSRTVVDL